jgi:outer membrane receptor protein involved in Fe transport
MDIIISAEQKGFTLTAGAYNIIDTKYADPVSSDHAQKTITQNGRNF